jgi:hypothetical protein
MSTGKSGFGSFHPGELTRRGGGVPSLESLLEALERLHPGLRVLDRDLELAPGRSVQLVAVDELGQLLLVLAAAEDDEGALLSTLDALSLAERDRALVAEHCGLTEFDAGIPARVIVISERFSERFLGRLGGFPGDLLGLYEVRTLSSASGRRAHLVPAGAHQQAQASKPRPTTEIEFGASLRADQRALLERLLQRATRIDAQIARSVRAGELTLELDRQALCWLRSTRGALFGKLPAGEGQGPLSRIANAQELETFLESLVEVYVAHWTAQQVSSGPSAGSSLAEEATRVSTGQPAPGKAAPHGPPASPATELESVGPSSEVLERVLDPTAPLLTPEEIAAFQRP